MRRAQHVRPSCAVWWTKVLHRLAQRIFDGGVAARQFFTHSFRGLKQKHGMSRGMVADKVTGGVNSADNLRTLADETADQKKSGADVVHGEDVQQLKCIWVVGAVIIGEREFVRVTTANDGVAENLRSGPHGGIGVSARGKRGRSSGGGDGGKHWL